MWWSVGLNCSGSSRTIITATLHERKASRLTPGKIMNLGLAVRSMQAFFLRRNRSLAPERLGFANPRPLGYECHHQQNLKTIRGAKSNALFLRRVNCNRACPCVALVIEYQ